MWTPSALASDARPFDGTAWRGVEAQARIVTRPLVDSLAEHERLEALLDLSKPPIPEACRHLDYLLFTPFRYAPYPRGSRFRRAGSPDGAFYASLAPRTALAELAFYRLLFQADAPGSRPPRAPDHRTLFQLAARTQAALDLRDVTFDPHRPAIEHKTDYASTQALADAAREAGIEALMSASVRDPERGGNLTLLACSTFAQREPLQRQTWRILTQTDRVECVADQPGLGAFVFHREAFGDPRLAGPGGSA